MKYQRLCFLLCVFVFAGCPTEPATDKACTPENNCVILDNGEFDCLPGYTWQNVNEANNFICVEDDCAALGRYGDGICDECAKPDPDCAASVTQNSSDNESADGTASNEGDGQTSEDSEEHTASDDETTASSDESAVDTSIDDQTSETDLSGDDETADDEETPADDEDTQVEVSVSDDESDQTVTSDDETTAEETSADDDATADETSGDDVTAGSHAPIILSLSTNVTTFSPLSGSWTEAPPPLIVTAVVTDPDGIDDLIGGILVDDDDVGTYGSFETAAAEGSYSLSISWGELNAVESINAPAEGVERVLIARFFDQTGNTVEGDVIVNLQCQYDGYELCDGECVDLETDKYNCGECGVSIYEQDWGQNADQMHCVDAQFACYGDEREICDGECVYTNSFHDGCGTCEQTTYCGQMREELEDNWPWHWDWDVYYGSCLEASCIFFPNLAIWRSTAESFQTEQHQWSDYASCEDVCTDISLVCVDTSDNTNCEEGAGCLSTKSGTDQAWNKTALSCTTPLPEIPTTTTHLELSCSCQPVDDL